MKDILRQTFNVYTLCTVVSHLLTLEIWSCLIFEGFTQPPNPIAIYPTYLSWGFCLTSLACFPLPLLRPLLLLDGLGGAFGVLFGLAFGVPFAFLAGVPPSISTTSSKLLVDLVVCPLPGLPGCFFLVTSLLNGVVWHLNSVAQPVCNAWSPVICSYKTKYMNAAKVLVCLVALVYSLLKFGKCVRNVTSLYIMFSSCSSSSMVLTDTCTAGNCICLMISRNTALSSIFSSKILILRAKFA